MLSARLQAARGRYDAMNGISYKNITVVFEDEYLLAASKPADLLVHGDGTGAPTLTDLVAEHLAAEGRGDVRPQAAQRLDVETTGLVLFSLDSATQPALDAEVAGRDMRKEYLAVVAGRFPWAQKAIDAPIGRHPVERKKMAINYKNGKEAVTHYRVLERFRNYTYIECQLETGRTHQIRVHLSSLHHPLLGDEVYGPKENPFHLEGQTLHAMVLGFDHPSTGEYIEFSAPLPEYFEKLLKKLPK